MKNKVLVFGGTTEGRLLSDYLREAKIPHEVSVATEYGGKILWERGEENLLVGRKKAEQIKELIESGNFSIVVDATHPFAVAASEEIKAACGKAGVACLRLKRETETKQEKEEEIVCVDTMEAAGKEAEAMEGNVLILTGSKELGRLTGLFSDPGRLYARVLPNVESIEACTQAGLSGRQIIAMQGPFSKQMNVALIREKNAGIVITKESGKAGGFQEKIDAVRECGIRAIVVKNPENASGSTDGYSLTEVLGLLSEHTGKQIRPKKTITLAGIGPGDFRYHTGELTRALREADIIFGAEAVVKNLGKQEVPVITQYRGEKILEYLEQNEGFTHPLVLFSGDISLCSGAKQATVFFEKKGFVTKRIVGISSVTLFAGRLGLSLEKVRLVNAHGTECDVMRAVLENEESIVLTSDAGHAVQICRQVLAAGLSAYAGCDLGTAQERVLDLGRMPECIDGIGGKCLIYVKNPAAANRPVSRILADEELLRGKVPMTKEEIRALSLRKLALTGQAVLWDIGAGTGSVSIEAALLSSQIKVYSVEKKEEAVSLLRRNKEKTGVKNLEIIEGEAMEVIDSLPAPTHVFIGGSGGNMKEILRAAFARNEKVRIVINTVTAESFVQVMEYIQEDAELEPDMIQIFACRFKKAGKYHLADALNPVSIVTLRKGKL